jgi:hypothetical protein
MARKKKKTVPVSVPDPVLDPVPDPALKECWCTNPLRAFWCEISRKSKNDPSAWCLPPEEEVQMDWQESPAERNRKRKYEENK